MARHLPRPGFAADLLHQIADLPHSGGTHGMALGFQAAAGIDRPFSREGSVAFHRIRTAAALGYKTQVLRGDDLRNSEAIMQFGEFDVLRTHTRHLISFLAGTAYGRKGRDVRFLIERYVVRGLGDTAYADRLISKFQCAFERRQDDG